MKLFLLQSLIWIIYSQTCRNTYHYEYNNTQSTDCGDNGFAYTPANAVGGRTCCDECERYQPICSVSRVVCRCGNATETCELSGGVQPFWGPLCTWELCADATCVQYYQCCSLKPCSNRTSHSSYEFPCGSSTCYSLPGSTSCVDSCPSSLYEGTPEGLCTLKPCTSRTADRSATYPCGESTCYAQPDGGCSTDCPASHYTIGSDGQCVLKTPCSSRTVNASATYTCGDWKCNEQPDEMVCAEGCPKEHYTVNSSSGKCVLAECNMRKVDSNATYLCGSADCYLNTNTSGCTDCRDSHLYELDASAGECILKDCSNRTLSSMSAYYCGDRNCLYDGYARACGLDCSLPEHYVANRSSGRCELRKCPDRLLYPDATYPCGSADCEYNANTQQCAFIPQSPDPDNNAGHTEIALGSMVGRLLFGLCVLFLLV